MGTTKKKVASKRTSATAAKAAKTKTKTVARKDLRAATAASVKAAIGKLPIGRPGILTGFWIEEKAIAAERLDPVGIAKAVALGVTAASGIRVRPDVVRGTGGVLVGYVQPAILKE